MVIELPKGILHHDMPNEYNLDIFTVNDTIDLKLSDPK